MLSAGARRCCARTFASPLSGTTKRLLQHFWPAQWCQVLGSAVHMYGLGPSASAAPSRSHAPSPQRTMSTRSSSTAASPQAGQTYTFEVSRDALTAGKAKIRLDAYLAERLGSDHTASRARVQGSIKAGLVTVNGRPCVKPSQQLVKGDKVTCTLQPGPSLEAQPEAIPLDIYYEDEYLMVINKPPGMCVHISPGHHTGTLVNALLAHCGLPGVRIDPTYPSTIPNNPLAPLSLDTLTTSAISTTPRNSTNSTATGSDLAPRTGGMGPGVGGMGITHTGMAGLAATGLDAGWVLDSEEGEGEDGDLDEYSSDAQDSSVTASQQGATEGPTIATLQSSGSSGNTTLGSTSRPQQQRSADTQGSRDGTNSQSEQQGISQVQSLDTLGIVGSVSVGQQGVLRPGIVHRLDIGTSGLLVVAKQERAQRALSAQFKARTVRRTYQSLTAGCPTTPSGRVMTNLDRDPADRKRMAAFPYGGQRGRTAASNYQVLERLADGAAALVQWKLETGRTHQIRVHAKHIGHPLLADKTYGGGAGSVAGGMSKGRARMTSMYKGALDALNRPALHAQQLGFTHPITGKELDFTCDMPQDMQELLGFLRSVESRL